jgi:hypothetical protein
MEKPRKILVDITDDDPECILCGRKLTERHPKDNRNLRREQMIHGNSASPVADGRCCDTCDCLIVLPSRMTFLGYQNAVGIGMTMLDLRFANIQIPLTEESENEEEPAARHVLEWNQMEIEELEESEDSN